MLEKEIDVIITSTVRAIEMDELAYLLPPAYKFLCSCDGFRDCGNWSGFTTIYTAETLRKMLFANQARNQKNPERAGIYNSIITALSRS